MLRFTTLPLLLPFALVTGLGAQTPAPAPDLSDPEVAHVAVTANSIDIALARFAQSRLTNAEVRRFAATMIADHSAVNAQAVALAQRLGVTPQDNAVSQSLQKGATEARAALEQLTGAAFERGYIEREVAFHQAVLDALDGLLIPTTTNADLKKLLANVRTAINAHLEHAKHLHTSLAAK